MKLTGPVRVLVVDDSPMVRALLTRVLSNAEGIEAVPGAKDPFEARERIIEHHPDVIILDIEMPRMDGLTFLQKLREHYPVPVIMCSGFAPANSRNAIRAIELGATDLIAKPRAGKSGALERFAEELVEKVRAAALSMPPRPAIPSTARPISTSFKAAALDPRRYVIAIGASTGGTEAIKSLLSEVPADFPPVVIVQHMPEGFTRSFAERLDQFSQLQVTEAADGDELIPGRAFLARGGTQMMLSKSTGIYRIAYGTDEPVNRHCPSVDVLFDSMVDSAGAFGVGILLTGMGADGAAGLKRMRDCGALTLAQDRSSSVVYGMPKVAHEMDAVDITITPRDACQAITQGLLSRRNPIRSAKSPART